MDSATNDVLSFVHERLLEGENCWLITVVSAWGSAPRLPGACLAWSPDHGFRGSLSGGCVEDDLLQKLEDGHYSHHSQPFFEIYGMTAADAAHWGLPCGGRLELLMEYLPATNDNKRQFQHIADAIATRQGLSRHITLNKPFDDPDISTLHTTDPHPLTKTPEQVRTYIGPRYRLMIIGANQVAQYLAEYCRTLDFEVWICDPREAAFAHWPLDFTENWTQPPDDLIRDKANDRYTAIIAVAHDPRIDDMALMEALTSDCFYIGAMGSQKSTQARLERLATLGLSQDQIDRLVAPVGLPIGSKTPAEIAMAIAADLIRVVRRP